MLTGWRKSSYSESGACVEWLFRKSSRCASNECTEAALRGGTVLVRDSKLGDASPVLKFSPAQWAEFLAGVKNCPIPAQGF